MADSDARFVYQLASTDVSPDKNHISSERDASSWRDIETLLGSAIKARAYWFPRVSFTLQKVVDRSRTIDVLPAICV